MSGEPYVITEACIDVTDRAGVDVGPVAATYPADQVPDDQRAPIDTNRADFAETSAR